MIHRSTETGERLTVVPFEKRQRRHHTITPTQVRILELTAEGYGLEDAGQKVGMTHQGVQRQRSRILDLLGAEDMANAVAIAIKRGLIDVNDLELD